MHLDAFAPQALDGVTRYLEALQVAIAKALEIPQHTPVATPDVENYVRGLGKRCNQLVFRRPMPFRGIPGLGEPQIPVLWAVTADSGVHHQMVEQRKTF